MAIPNKIVIPLLVGFMLLTGCANTLLTKFQDKQCVRNCDPDDPKKGETFEQPVLQTLQMFIGESGCWLVLGLYKLYVFIQQRRSGAVRYEAVASSEEGSARRSSSDGPGAAPSSPVLKALTPNAPERTKLSGVKILLLALPASCDICATTLMNIGLLFVAASIYQMTRGALVLFVALFSVLFLKRHVFGFQWFALIVVVVGVGLVGLAGALFKDHKIEADALTAHLVSNATGSTHPAVAAMAADASVVRTVIGILLIASAQIFTATQFVLEEYILERYSMEPIRVVGYEGIFGTVVTGIGMVILHFAIGRTSSGQYGYFDAAEGLREMQIPAVWKSSLCIMISIGAFNFFGISVTRSLSATSRSTIDTCRTLFIWLASMGLGWETFKWLQVVGFALLVYGTFLFNEIINPPLRSCLPAREEREIHEDLLPEEIGEHF